jgi:hypothetical protein
VNVSVGVSFPATSNHTSGGSFAGASAVVVQVYYSRLSTSSVGVRYKKMLAGFTKAWIGGTSDAAAGMNTGMTSMQDRAGNGTGDVADEVVTVSVRVDDLGSTVVDNIRGTHDWVVEPGEYMLLACRSECDCPLNTTITI